MPGETDAKGLQLLFPHNYTLWFFLSDELTAVRVLISMGIMFMLGALGYPPFFKQMSGGILKIGIMSILSGIAGTLKSFYKKNIAWI